MEEGEGDQVQDQDLGDEEVTLEEGLPLKMGRVGSVGWVSGDRHRRMEVSTWVGESHL
jgi:hypothetical protein